MPQPLRWCFTLRPYAGERFVYIISLNKPKYTVDGMGSARPDHQGEDDTQTYYWQWQPPEYNKLQTALGPLWSALGRLGSPHPRVNIILNGLTICYLNIQMK